MNEKIYFIIDTPIVKSYISYYALDAFSEHNIEYVLIDVSPLINKRAYKSVKSDLIDYSEPNIYYVKVLICWRKWLMICRKRQW